MDPTESNLIRFNLDQHRLGNADIEQLLHDIVSSVKGLERKNDELQKRNDELRAELQRANETLARFEQPEVADAELARQALQMAVQVLANAEELAREHIRAAKAQSADGYEEAARRALELQRESVAVLEKAQQESQQRQREADQEAQQTLAQARESILSMAEELNGPVSASALSPLRFVERLKTVESRNAVGISEPETTSPVEAALLDAMSEGRPRSATAPAEARSLVSDASFQPGMVTGSSAMAGPELDARSGLATTIVMTASPFDSIAGLVAFQRAIRHLPGVLDVSVRAFNRDTVQLAVRYSGPLPLASRLMSLSEYSLQPLSASTNKIEVRLVSGKR